MPLSGLADPVRIIFLGDSLTAGYGLAREEAYPALLETRVQALRRDAKVVNAGVSGDTTAGGLRRIGWVMAEGGDVLVVALGANDGLRGVDPGETERNLMGIIDAARKKNPRIKILLAGMQMPPNMGLGYTADFARLFPKVAKVRGVELIPFLLEGVAGRPELNQEDGIHPTAAGQRIVANVVWSHLRPLLEEIP